MGRKTRSAREAHDLHATFRSYLLLVARVFAVQIAQEKGTVTVKDVRPRMVEAGYIAAVPVDDLNGPTESWFGSVCSGAGVFEPTGERVPRHDGKRNAHAGKDDTVAVWRLKAGADITRYATMPPVPTDVPVAPPKAVAREVVVVPFDRRAAAEELRSFTDGRSIDDNTRAALAWLES